MSYNLLDTTNTPYKIYAENLDEKAIEQFYDVLNEPYVTYGALMPDAHGGYTMPIGGVCSTKGKIVPQFVGFDIGCGMCAYKTDFIKEEVENMAKHIHFGITQVIPTGVMKHPNKQPIPDSILNMDRSTFANEVLNSIGGIQLGTLGGGNHFIEIGYGRDNKVWIIIHSGSRGVGGQIARHYMDKAFFNKSDYDKTINKKLNEMMVLFSNKNKKFKEHNPTKYEEKYKQIREKYKSKIIQKLDVDKQDGIYPLDVTSSTGQDYTKDMNFALQFALENRKHMIQSVHSVLRDAIGRDYEIDFNDEDRFINRNHNHAEFDENKNEWIHRKGATHAENGMMGVIPGNMRDGSFIVRGKGCEGSLCSSSHGAGRVMSRRQATMEIDFEDYKNTMKGVVGTITENTIDEAPFAYKNIFEVMEMQRDLVEVIDYIKPLINVKDDSKNYYLNKKK